MSDDQFHDRFDRAFNQRIPREVAHSFTDEQRAAIRLAFGGERWDGHAVDIRGVIPFVRWYFAFVSGPDRRKKRRARMDGSPRPGILSRLIGAVITLVMLVALALLAVLLLS